MEGASSAISLITLLPLPGSRGLHGYGVYADAVNFHSQILDGPDGGLGGLQVIRFGHRLSAQRFFRGSGMG